MTCCEIITNILIGIISGLISGFLTSVWLKKHWDKKEIEEQFEMEKQTYERYLQRIREEILIGEKLNDYSYVLRTIENEPIRKTFNQLDENSRKSIVEIQKCIKKLKNEIEIGNGNFEVTKGMLFKYQMDVLKYRRKDK